MRKKLLDYLKSFLIAVGVFALLLIVSLALRLGTKWEDWKSEGNFLILIFSLSTYRIIEYTLPAIVIKMVRKKKWIEAFNVQFACYAFLGALLFVFGLDYVLDIELFASADNFIIVIGYVMTVLSGKQHEIKNTFDITEE